MKCLERAKNTGLLEFKTSNRSGHVCCFNFLLFVGNYYEEHAYLSS